MTLPQVATRLREMVEEINAEIALPYFVNEEVCAAQAKIVMELEELAREIEES